MILNGYVKSGLGEASFWMKKAQKAFEKKIGVKMFCGTLNIELEKEYILDKNLDKLLKEDYGGMQDVYIKECRLFGNKSYILRTDKNMSKDRDHPLNIIEVISDINFRKKYHLKDGDKIKIEIVD